MRTRGAESGRGSDRPCVRMGGKLPCAMWSDRQTDRDMELTTHSPSKDTPTMPFGEPILTEETSIWLIT